MNGDTGRTSLPADGRTPAAGAETQASAPGSDGFEHVALIYHSEAEYLAKVSAFVRAALARDEPVLVAVPGARIGPLRAALAADGQQVAFADMTEAGRNPGGIIPFIRSFADGSHGGRASYVSETTWPSRSAGALLEAAKHEALMNLGFAGRPLTALCPYDAAALPPGALSLAEQTHPLLAGRHQRRASPAYLGRGGIPKPCLGQLPDPPASAEVVIYHDDLRPVRAFVNGSAAVAGLCAGRTTDLVIAVSELAANTLAHTPRGGRLRVWRTRDEIVCEISDGGWIADPLAGRHSPPGDQPGGHGLWLVNQVCDLVETRTSAAEGTTTRVHMSLDG